MPIEAVRHAVSRLWLYAFAGIVAAVCAAPYARASGPVAVTDANATGAFSQSTNGRDPVRAFATDLGVYELDTSIKCVRIWQRGGDGNEMFRPQGSSAFHGYSSQQLEVARPRPQRFMGVDADGNGIQFKQPVAMDMHPDGGKFAVVSAGEYINQNGNQYCPSIQVYEIAETAGEDETLSEVLVSLAAEYRNAFHETTNGWEQVIDRIWQYPDVLITTNYYSDGTIRSVTTNTFVEYETTLLDRQLSTNWVYIASTNAEGAVSMAYTNGQSRTGKEDPVWWNPLQTDLLVPGFEYTFVQTNDWVSVSTNYYSLTNWVFRPYGITTNSSYLATATDVAFLGDEGLVASITAEDYQAVRSAFLVFGSDPEAPAKLFPVEGLDKAIKGIAVDKESGDIYAAVPDLSAVFRYPSPGGSPGSWTSKEDRTPVARDEDFVAGVTNAPGSTPGRLSNPADVAVWYPEEEPFLLVADTANNRIQAFDPNSLNWAETNWLGTNPPRRPSSPDGLLPVFFDELGTSIRLDPETGLPFDPDILPFVETNGMDVVTNYYHAPAYVPYVTTNGNGVVTNYYRLETTAFPVFSTADFDGLSADPPKGPKGAWGQDGTTTFVLADTGKSRVRVLDIADLSAIDSDEILAMAVWWPSVGGGAQGLAARDMFVADGSSGGSVVYWDAAAAEGAPEKVHVVREHETYENELHFTVTPSRHDRTYTLSVAGAAGVVDPVLATATVPAGSTEGVFTFVARDGIVSTETRTSWRDQHGNWVPEGDPKAVRSVEERIFASPAYTLSVSSDGGFATNALLAVANVDPIVTSAQVIGYVVPADPPYVQALGMRVEAADASGADDSSLSYLWWASTNVNWAVNHRDWAVTNHDWAASASGEWSDGPSFPAEQNTTASVITGTETDGPVTNTVCLMVARGQEVRLPPYTFGRTKIDEDGYPLASEPGTTPFYIVCTVLDKDGGHTIVSFPTPSEPSGYSDVWTGVYDRDVVPEGATPSDAVYRARFTSVSGTNVAFEVTLSFGTALSTDSLRLESATSLDGSWSTLKSVNVGSPILSKGSPASFSVSPAGGGEVRFYRIVRP